MIDLVLTHLTHPWGPPWTLETLGDHWRPLATLGDHAWKWSFWPFLTFYPIFSYISIVHKVLRNFLTQRQKLWLCQKIDFVENLRLFGVKFGSYKPHIHAQKRDHHHWKKTLFFWWVFPIPILQRHLVVIGVMWVRIQYYGEQPTTVPKTMMNDSRSYRSLIQNCAY